MTVQYVATVGLSLILLVLFANLLVDLYVRGAVRDALDEGVRAAAPAGSGRHECEERAHEVVDGLVARRTRTRCARLVRSRRDHDGRACRRHIAFMAAVRGAPVAAVTDGDDAR